MKKALAKKRKRWYSISVTFRLCRRKGEIMKNKVDIKATEMLLPKAYRPLSSWDYFGRTVLYLIPIVGQIFVLAHAMDDKNRHGRSFARSFMGFLLLVAAAAFTAFVLKRI